MKNLNDYILESRGMPVNKRDEYERNEKYEKDPLIANKDSRKNRADDRKWSKIYTELFKINREVIDYLGDFETTGKANFLYYSQDKGNVDYVKKMHGNNKPVGMMDVYHNLQSDVSSAKYSKSNKPNTAFVGYHAFIEYDSQHIKNLFTKTAEFDKTCKKYYNNIGKDGVILPNDSQPYIAFNTNLNDDLDFIFGFIINLNDDLSKIASDLIKYEKDIIKVINKFSDL